MEKCLQNGGVLVEWKKQMLKIQLLYHAYKELTLNVLQYLFLAAVVPCL